MGIVSPDRVARQVALERAAGGAEPRDGAAYILHAESLCTRWLILLQ